VLFGIASECVRQSTASRPGSSNDPRGPYLMWVDEQAPDLRLIPPSNLSKISVANQYPEMKSFPEFALVRILSARDRVTCPGV
jgi:hypothetical protein